MKHARFVGLVLLTAALNACGGGGDSTSTQPPTPPAPASVASVQLSGAPVTPLDVGLTATLTATPRSADGAAISGRTVTWTSSGSAVATVSSSGVVSAVSTGQTTITATVDGVSGSATVQVLALPSSLVLLSGGRWLLVGDTLQLTAEVRDRLGRAMDTTVARTITGGAATLSMSGPRAAVATAAAPGTATVRATLGALSTELTLNVASGGGVRVGALAMLDSIVVNELRRLGIPGASVAVARNGALMFARAYGYADTATRRPMATNTMLRVGSTSKPLTAVAVHRLVQEGALSLDDKPFAQQLTALTPRPGQSEDARLAQVTVRDLLQHSAGWATTRAVDDSVWAAFWRDGVNDQFAAARYGRGVPLTVTPGTQFAYNNYGYQLLGRVIEQVTGESYEDAVKRLVLAPAGVTAMRLGRTPLAARDAREATCYDGLPSTTGRFGTGAWCDVVPGMEYYEASGSWIGSATDMLRWMSVVDGHQGARADVLSAATISSMTARNSTLWPGTGPFYALGWEVMNEAGGSRWYHGGAAMGGDGHITRLPNGVSVVILANLTRGSGAGGGTLDPAVIAAVRAISAWPSGVDF